MKVVLLPLLCLDAPAREIPQPAILNVRHEVLPDRDTTRMVGAIREGCTSADDNFCTAADGLIHSELRIHIAVLRHGRPLNHRIRASVSCTVAHVRPTRTRTHFRWLTKGTGLPLGPKWIFTGVGMSSLANFLSQWLGRPVFDKTGLDGL